MLRIRKVKTKSGSTVMPVAQYMGYSAKIVKHIGSSSDDIERDVLINKAQERIGKCTIQSNLFPGQKQNVLIVEREDALQLNTILHISFLRVASMNAI